MQVVHSGVLVDTNAYHASMTMFVEITGCHEDVSAFVSAVPRGDVSVKLSMFQSKVHRSVFMMGAPW